MSETTSEIENTAGGKVKIILERLQKEYGIPVWRPHGDPVSVLVKTILSQNTSDANSEAAFRSLLAGLDKWEQVINADTDDIARCIWSGGLGKIKAQRIKQTLRGIVERNGQLELDFLGGLPPPVAQKWLEELGGVGPKTACCVLLFSLGIPALPVDTHILRVSKRLGLIDSGTQSQEAHRLLQEMVPKDSVYQFHILMIEHGRKICRARKPRCRDCMLADLFPSCRPD